MSDAPENEAPENNARKAIESPVTLHDRLDKLGRIFENTLLLLILLAMLSVAVAQIVSRNFFNSGFIWSDEFLRLTVLWVAMLGGLAAARDHKHLRIDVLSHFFASSVTRWTGVLVDLFTTVICGMLAWYSYLFVAETREYEDLAFGQHPLWLYQLILPLGFALIAWRYLIWTGRGIQGKSVAEMQA